MELTADNLKVLVDIGLGAVSLMLWFRQGKLTSGLTKMVQDHENRIELLESIPISKLSKRKRG